ncbi:MAG: hypothetical protein M8467_15390 [Anaerolineae bacterium]|nr:hypothetical protein [Anaerolineae bacterium]
MMGRKRLDGASAFWRVLVFALLMTLLASCALRATGEELVQSECTRCHTLAPIEVASKTSNEWQDTVHRMIEHGANLSEGQVMRVVDYLAESYGPASP